MSNTSFPPPLQPGDTIAILSPAGIIKPDYVYGAEKVLRGQGWNVRVMPNALGHCGSYSGTPYQRLDDFNEALSDPSVRAILCSRGGYGAVHLLDRFPINKIKQDPRWIIGFSDISALHALLSRHGIASIHASMCRHLALNGGDDPYSQHLFDILRGNAPTYSIPTDCRSIPGKATGKLVGGNLAVLQALMHTPYDILSTSGAILFVEDIAEPIYKIERIFYQLRLSGILHRINGLILGQFTEYTPDRNHNNTYDAILPLVADLGIPIAVNFPVGHTDQNLPLIESSTTTIKITTITTTLTTRRGDIPTNSKNRS